MAKVIDISELISLVCDKLIEYGVQPHTVWSDYSYNYRPILHFFQEHGCSHYDEGLLMQYRQEQQERYEREDLLRKNYLNKTRAVSRLQEFYRRGDLSHVVAGGHAKKHINNANESLLREFIAWSGPANPKTLLDMEWAVRKYLFWLETQGVDDALDVNAHSFSGFMTLASRKYAEGSLHDLQLFLKKFHQFLNTEKGLDIPYEFVLSLPVIRKKRVFPPLTKDEIQRTVAQVDRSTFMGKRDYAIILLSARNGLRGSDIIHLKLTDIDWRGGEIRLIQKKTGNPLVLPLLPDVGEALKEYILNGRPDSRSEFIFLRALHPYLPFNRTMALSHLWSGYQKKAGIERYAHDGKGFHALRRTLGRELTLAEIPIMTTAQILGHRSVDSSKQYISLDSAHLKECALDFSGIEVAGEGYGNE